MIKVAACYHEMENIQHPWMYQLQEIICHVVAAETDQSNPTYVKKISGMSIDT